MRKNISGIHAVNKVFFVYLHPKYTISMKDIYHLYSSFVLFFVLFSFPNMVWGSTMPTDVRSYRQPTGKVTMYNTDKGLPASVISGMTQGDDNLLWMASWNGLTCFDGYRFSTFDNSSVTGYNLLFNHLTNITHTASNKLWAETYGGMLYLFDTHSCVFVDVKKKIKTLYNEEFDLRKVYPLANGASWLVGKGATHFRVCEPIDSAGAIKRFVLNGILNKVAVDGNGHEWCFTDKSTYVDGRPVSSEVFEYVFSARGKTVLIGRDGRMASFNKSLGKVSTLGIKINDAAMIDDRHLCLAGDRIVVYDIVSGRLVSVSGFEQDVASKLFVDSRHRVWVFGNKPGVWLGRIKGSGMVIEHITPGLTGNETLTQADRPVWHEDKFGTVWVIPSSSSFAYYDETSCSLVPHSLKVDGIWGGVVPRVKYFFSDNQHNLWLISPHNLSKVTFTHQATVSFSREDNRETRAVCQLKDGTVAIGCVDGRVIRCDANGNIVGYLDKNGKWSNMPCSFSTHIYSMYEQKDGSLWIGTKGDGLYIRNAEGKMLHFVHNSSDRFSLSDDNVYDIHPDSRGRMLIATFGGGLNIIPDTKLLASTGKGRFVHAGNILRGLDANTFSRVRRVDCVRNGVVVVSTTEGLVCFSDNYSVFGKIRFFITRHTDDDSSLSSNNVMQTCMTNDGRLYVTTLGGRLQRVTSENLLQNNLSMEFIRDTDGRPIEVLNGERTVIGLAADNADGLWIVGESRIACYIKGRLTVYGSNELGHVNITEARPSYDKSHDRLIIATEGGAVGLYPRDLIVHSETPKMVFTALTYMDSDDLIPLLHKKNIEVDVDHRSFTISFAALDYSDNDGIRYAYRIDNGKWEYVGNGGNSASFNNFPAGNHVLQVRSTDRYGVWTDNMTEISIYAQPTFVESWWGRTLIALAIIFILALAVGRYMKHKKKTITEEATEKADAGKVRFVLRKPEVVDEDKILMDRLVGFIDSHMSDPDLKVEDMADAVGMSRSVFYQRMKSIADVSPNDFLRHVRMQRAEDLIRESAMNFSQIAYAVGFTDPKYFSKCFKKHTGLSPSDFRKQSKII